MNDFALGNITTSYTVGSAVKGATILTGYQAGVIRPGSTFFDGPIKIKDTAEKSSWRNFGTLNDVRALRVSSNVYMFRTAMAIAKANYVYNQPLPFDQDSFDTMRQSFSQFGLGVRTGIDLPNEAIGFKGTITSYPGLLLDFAIGQYDTYTPMQLAQYVSTIANGGYRISPHIVKEIRAPLIENDQLGPVIEEIQPTILNRLDLKNGWMKNVQEGFRQVMQNPEGTGYGKFGNAPYLPAGKTGTAQAFYDGPNRSNYEEAPAVNNLSLVGYAPYNNPEVAMSVVVPWVYTGRSGPSINTDIGRRVLDAYFDLKKTREEE
jgi:cell division protein FtsI/penicillin-binding protein 2